MRNRANSQSTQGNGSCGLNAKRINGFRRKEEKHKPSLIFDLHFKCFHHLFHPTKAPFCLGLKHRYSNRHELLLVDYKRRTSIGFNRMFIDLWPMPILARLFITWRNSMVIFGPMWCLYLHHVSLTVVWTSKLEQQYLIFSIFLAHQ